MVTDEDPLRGLLYSREEEFIDYKTKTFDHSLD